MNGNNPSALTLVKAATAPHGTATVTCMFPAMELLPGFGILCSYSLRELSAPRLWPVCRDALPAADAVPRAKASVPSPLPYTQHHESVSFPL